jgi:hypothetical protein
MREGLAEAGTVVVLSTATGLVIETDTDVDPWVMHLCTAASVPAHVFVGP